QGPAFALCDDEGRAIEGWQLLDGPWDVACETRWLLRLADGRQAVLGQLSRELARDQSVRRRWLRDVDRLRSSPALSVAPVLATGAGDTEVAPWRLRLEPQGERLSEWLARAPIPIDELAHRGAALADALHAVHLGGHVVRKLHPRDLVWTLDQRIILTDIGLARVDLLSSHTASSLLVSGSAYSAPEQLLRTVVDQRADLYSLGVILWQAATGTLPFGEGPALLRERVELPPVHGLRPEAPPVLDMLLRRCLAEQPEDRPESAAEVAWVLRGGAGDGLLQATATVCQHCGAPLRLGQRLCLACGRLGVRFGHASDPRRGGWSVELRSLSEDANLLAALRDFIVAVADQPFAVDEFVIGDATLYSEQELISRKRLPARLFDNLDEETARELCRRMREQGLDVEALPPGHGGRWFALTGLSLAGTIAGSLAMGAIGAAGGWVAAVVIAGLGSTIFSASRASSAVAESKVRPLHRLRRLPAALPASDPLVARMAAMMEGDGKRGQEGSVPADVRAVLFEMALLVQRLVDRRAQLTGLVEAREFAMLTEPVEPLIGELERRVAELTRFDRELADLDEGAMMRQLASLDVRLADQDKRAIERERLLTGLDRLRTLEDRRTATFHGILEAVTLLRRAGEMGLGVHDPAAEQQRRVDMALAALSPR
ncbi:MAG: protein kinase, partial [Myxococcales bacterium]|nr:protein kinase [Myxococcales bacterium]